MAIGAITFERPTNAAIEASGPQARQFDEHIRIQLAANRTDRAVAPQPAGGAAAPAQTEEPTLVDSLLKSFRDGWNSLVEGARVNPPMLDIELPPPLYDGMHYVPPPADETRQTPPPVAPQSDQAAPVTQTQDATPSDPSDNTKVADPQPNDQSQAGAETNGIGLERPKIPAELTNVAEGRNVLRAGNGSDVQAAQRLLIEAGEKLLKHGADGRLGGETRAAVKAFQGKEGLPQTGEIDKATLGSLVAKAGKNDGKQHGDISAAPADGGSRTKALGPGSPRSEIRAAQQQLEAAGYKLPKHGADGSPGEETRTAVRDFQREAGLRETGLIDGATRDKLAARATEGTAERGLQPKTDKPVSVGIAFFGPDKHSSGDINTFKGGRDRTGAKLRMEAHTGRQFIDRLVEASKQGPISHLYVASHSSLLGLHGAEDQGLYENWRPKNTEGKEWRPVENAATLSDIQDKINNGEIRFAPGAKIYFLGCNVGSGSPTNSSFAEKFSSIAPGTEVTAAQGRAAPMGVTGTYVADGKWATARDGKIIGESKGNKFRPPHPTDGGRELRVAKK